MRLKFSASCLLLVAGAVAQTPPAKQQTGLVAQLNSLGVSQENYPYLTASVTLTNNSPVHAFVLLVGPPSAVDNSGGTFQYAAGAVTGIAYCVGREGLPAPAPHTCIGKPMEQDFLFAPDSYTQIEPGKSASFNVVLRNLRGVKGTKFSLTQEIAYRLVKPEDIDKDESVPADKKLKAVRMGSISFSNVAPDPKESVTSTIKFDAVK